MVMILFFIFTLIKLKISAGGMVVYMIDELVQVDYVPILESICIL